MTKGTQNENIVKKIFERPKGEAEKVSFLFTQVRKVVKKPFGKELTASGPSQDFPVAIDFGTSSIRVLQLARDTEGKLEVALIDQEAYDPPLVADTRAGWRDALKKIQDRNRIGNKVVVGLSAKEIQTYNLVFPPMPEAELKEAVRWKVAQLKPFGLEPDAIRHGLIPRKAPSTKSSDPAEGKVLVVCVARETLLEKKSLLSELNLKVASFQITPVSLIHSQGLKRLSASDISPTTEGLASKEVVMWLDLGAQESSFVIERGGQVLFLKNLSSASKQWTRQIARHSRVSDKEAEELKRRFGLSFWSPEKSPSVPYETNESSPAEDKAAEVFYGLVSSLENLVVDIEHSFKYFSYQVSQSQITRLDRVWLGGGGSKLKNLDRFLSFKLGAPVELMDPFTGCKGKGTLQKEDFLTEACDFAPVTGLAVSSVLKTSPSLSLFDPDEKRTLDFFIQAGMDQAKKRPLVTGVCALVLLGLFLLPPMVSAAYYQARAVDVKAEFKSVQSELSWHQSLQLELAEEESTLLRKNKILEAKLHPLEQSRWKGKPLSEVLARFASLVPEEIWIAKLSYQEGRLTILGAGAQSYLVVKFIESLKEAADFQDVTFHYTQWEPGESVYHFEITAGVV